MIYSDTTFDRRKTTFKSVLFNLISAKEVKSPLFYGVGLPRSGTTSLSLGFKKRLASFHEPLSSKTIDLIIRYKEKKYSKWELCQIMKYRQRVLNADIECAHYLHYIVPELIVLFPDTKFVLTYREPLSWIKSEIIKNSATKYSHWLKLQDFRYKKYGAFSKETWLQNIPHTYAIDQYLLYWKDHLKFVMNCVPDKNLFKVSTKKLKSSIDDLASFLNIPSDFIDIELMWTNKGRSSVSYYFDDEYIARRIESVLLPFIKRNVPSLISEMEYL